MLTETKFVKEDEVDRSPGVVETISLNLEEALSQVRGESDLASSVLTLLFGPPSATEHPSHVEAKIGETGTAGGKMYDVFVVVQYTWIAFEKREK